LRDGGLSARDPTRETHNRLHRGPVLDIVTAEQDDWACAT
jgi:hypothetical protein